MRVRGPAWGNTLSEADIEAVIAWFQSLWPDPIHAAWADTDRRARTGGGARQGPVDFRRRG